MSYRENLDEISFKIINTANTLFTRHGVEAVSMHQVAQTAGIGQGTLYRRYSNKSRLCLAIMKSKLDLFMEDVEQYLQAAKERPVLERLSTLIEKVVGLTQENMEWMKAVTHSERLEEAKDNCFEAPHFKQLTGWMRTLLEEAARNGELIDLKPDIASTIIASSFSPMLILHLHNRGYSSEQIAMEYCRTFIAPLFVDLSVHHSSSDGCMS